MSELPYAVPPPYAPPPPHATALYPGQSYGAIGNPGYDDTHIVVFHDSTDQRSERSGILGRVATDNATKLLFSDKRIRRRFVQKVFAILLVQMLFLAGFIAMFLFVAYQTWIVLLAFGITISSTVVVILLCFWTKYDLTSKLGIISMVALGIVFFGIFSIFFYSRIIILLYSALMALILLVFLAVDTQMLLGGKRVELSEEDYVLGASQLFVDVVMLFTVLLTLIGAARQ